MDFGWALHASFWITYGPLTWLWWRDRRAGAEETIPYAATMALVAALEVTMAPIAESATREAAAAALTR
jgi:hypothetical protein